jgi:kynurenine formamidase
MKIIDLSHTINDSITVFNEAERPNIQVASTHQKDGYAQKRFTMYSHNSTHVDAPYHIIPGGKTLDQFTTDKFYGPGLIIDSREFDEIIKIEDLEPYADALRGVDFLILMTGWYLKWNGPEYRINFPVLSAEAAEWLIQFDLKGIGLDTISIDEVSSKELPVHHIILGNNLIIIENLTNLEELIGKKFTFSCFPLKFEEADGSPVRAVGIIQ